MFADDTALLHTTSEIDWKISAIFRNLLRYLDQKINFKKTDLVWFGFFV